VDFVVEGRNDEKWFLSSDLRELALQIIDENEELQYIDTDKVVFMGVVGAVSSQKWWGQCTRLMPKMKLISMHVASKLIETFGEDAVDTSLLDLRYLIAINIDSIAASGGDVDEITRVTMHHELLHIDPTMEKIVDHNIKDFSSILDRYGVHWTKGMFKNDTGEESTS
jgi:hypothetical protein